MNSIARAITVLWLGCVLPLTAFARPTPITIRAAYTAMDAAASQGDVNSYLASEATDFRLTSQDGQTPGYWEHGGQVAHSFQALIAVHVHTSGRTGHTGR